MHKKSRPRHSASFRPFCYTVLYMMHCRFCCSLGPRQGDRQRHSRSRGALPIYTPCHPNELIKVFPVPFVFPASMVSVIRRVSTVPVSVRCRPSIPGKTAAAPCSPASALNPYDPRPHYMIMLYVRALVSR
jgi:hypothetical protein